ncbi:MAG: hypothetical protein FWD68_08285 [Alphaproteobacteria bacterium]|nr:hypothetical protein [Alphaproteobacteria bacterium]
MPQFDTGVVGCELPICLGMVRVAMFLPGCDLPHQWQARISPDVESPPPPGKTASSDSHRKEDIMRRETGSWKLEVIGLSGDGRHRYSPASKRRRLDVCLRRGALIPALAAHHRINAALLYKWVAAERRKRLGDALVLTTAGEKPVRQPIPAKINQQSTERAHRGRSHQPASEAVGSRAGTLQVLANWRRGNSFPSKSAIHVGALRCPAHGPRGRGSASGRAGSRSCASWWQTDMGRKAKNEFIARPPRAKTRRATELATVRSTLPSSIADSVGVERNLG